MSLVCRKRSRNNDNNNNNNIDNNNNNNNIPTHPNQADSQAVHGLECGVVFGTGMMRRQTWIPCLRGW